MELTSPQRLERGQQTTPGGGPTETTEATTTQRQRLGIAPQPGNDGPDNRPEDRPEDTPACTEKNKTYY